MHMGREVYKERLLRDTKGMGMIVNADKPPLKQRR